MNQKIVDYLGENKENFSKETLVEQLKTAGYDNTEINEGVEFVYSSSTDVKAGGKNKFKTTGIGCVVLIVLVPVVIAVIWVLLALAFIMFGDKYYSWAESSGLKTKKVIIDDEYSNIDSNKSDSIKCLQKNDFKCFSEALDATNIDDIPLYKGTPLIHLVANHGKRNFLLRTLESGADIDMIDETSPSKPTPIFSAIMARNFENVELLMDAGANINIVGVTGWTPMRYAAALNEYGLVLNFLKAGADWSVVDNNGKTLIEQIQTSRIDKQSPEYKNLKECIKFLHSNGVSVYEPK